MDAHGEEVERVVVGVSDTRPDETGRVMVGELVGELVRQSGVVRETAGIIEEDSVTTEPGICGVGLRA